jgi:hypothetical protein
MVLANDQGSGKIEGCHRVIASANFGIDMAFPPAERVAFERDSLFPLAGLDPSLAEGNAAVRQIVERLNYARKEVARWSAFRALLSTPHLPGALR